MSETRWWRDTAIYHIYPRSFQDTDGDGFGDLPGITRRLGHIRDLGAGAIWMGPIFSSPQVDNGYDISDYCAIDSRFGTEDDFDALLVEAERKGIRVLLDLVFNHSSNQHTWFQESTADPEGPYGDYYIWKDAPAGAAAAQSAYESGAAQVYPNNWRSWFSQPAWTWSPARQQFYLHLFASEQPDLNWELPAVRRACADVANFWLERGVSGFRMDVINAIAKEPEFASLPEPDGKPPAPESGTGYYLNGRMLLPYLQEFRSNLVSDDHVLLVGETPAMPLETARALTDPANEALDMLLLFDHLMVDHGPGGKWDPVPWNPVRLKRVIRDAQHALASPCWPSLYTANHDQPRIVSRFGDTAAYRRESAKALATLFFLQRGTPIIYQGDEIGMANLPLTSPDQLADLDSINAVSDLVQREGISVDQALQRVSHQARDNGRSPMQWDSGRHADFTQGEPWYPCNPDYVDWNAAEQDGDPGSILGFFRKLLSLRARRKELRYGGFVLRGADDVADDTDAYLFAYDREHEGIRSGIVVNCSSETRQVEESLIRGTILLCNYEQSSRDGRVLRPWEALVIDRSE